MIYKNIIRKIILRVWVFTILLAIVSCRTIKPSGSILIYAYSRPVILGYLGVGNQNSEEVPYSKDDTVGKTYINHNEGITTYYIYLQQDNPGIEVKKVWVKGEAFDATLQRVDLPVIIKSGVSDKVKKVDTLIPVKPTVVFRVIPTEKIHDKANRKKRSLVNNNDVVLEMISGGENLTGVKKKFIGLTPIVLQ